ncbi:apolipoprotein N-acyltransferase [Kibdelosporangium banguiense]|uniref:Apolipoprotein N-acyltransferase n=1 Tax=Kibdelosporangium banguiense TaxID=1365924 RepID=A0ABS4TEB3_9PSEU|nr:ABA4-like family protein [Kibdelosporangium banguiense]MBP2322755.1 apolipoprotein N-acyltransferase [Kibdelosporangium banguiense]
MSFLFQLSFYLAAPFWALMIVAPRWSWTARVIGSPLIAAPVALLYLVIAVPRLADLLPLVTGPTLSGLQSAMADGGAATLVWAHIIAFDLFMGRWIYLESSRLGVHPLVTVPILIVTILFAPIGFLVFLIVRAARKSTRERLPVDVGSRP